MIAFLQCMFCRMFLPKLLFMKIFPKKISDYLSAILHRPKTIKKLLKLRYFLFSFRKPLKIGFLRLYNEEYTVIPCLMSVIDMVDIIVLIYSDIDDSSLELVKRYIKENKLEKKFIIRHYPYKVFTQHAPEYKLNTVKWENTLAAYYEFGYKICRRLARFRNGFIFKIDADQIYVNDCFNHADSPYRKLLVRTE